MKKLVLDIGGTFIKYAVMNREAEILEKGKEKTPLDTLENLVKTIKKIYGTFKDEVTGIAISMPGNIDSETGQVYTPGSLAYNEGINIIEELNKHIDLPISVENDGKSAALAEAWMGNLKECNDGIVMIIGTGIGGGIIKDKKIHKGKNFFAGEFSFIMGSNNEANFDNVFAMQGSTSALIKKVAEVKGINEDELDGYEVFNLIEKNDEETLKVFNGFAKTIGIQIFNLQCILDPEKILIGGGISKQKILLEKIKENLDEIYKEMKMFKMPQAKIDTCKYFNDSNLIGALYNYYLHFEN
nr:ROK family protein [uncultured Clostridium sp.]